MGFLLCAAWRWSPRNFRGFCRGSRSNPVLRFGALLLGTKPNTPSEGRILSFSGVENGPGYEGCSFREPRRIRTETTAWTCPAGLNAADHVLGPHRHAHLALHVAVEQAGLRHRFDRLRDRWQKTLPSLRPNSRSA